MESSSSYPVSPPEQRCVWMSAGILTYQLCDRGFDCANCPLDKAMRNMVKESEGGDMHRIPLRVDPLRLGRYYTLSAQRTRCASVWIRILLNGVVV